VKVVAFFGRTKTGKTSLIERLIAELKGMGYRVLAVKHVNLKGFSLDTPGKDTWRFTKAGADRVICVSDVEFATLERISGLDADSLLERIKGDFDLALLEGFHWLLKGRPEVQKVVLGNEIEDVEPFLEGECNVVAITGRVAEGLGESYKGIRVLKPEEFGELLELIKP